MPINHEIKGFFFSFRNTQEISLLYCTLTVTLDSIQEKWQNYTPTLTYKQLTWVKSPYIMQLKKFPKMALETSSIYINEEVNFQMNGRKS